RGAERAGPDRHDDQPSAAQARTVARAAFRAAAHAVRCATNVGTVARNFESRWALSRRVRINGAIDAFDHPDRHSDSAAHRSVADVALQLGLGLRAGWRTRADTRHRGRPGVAWTNIR